MSLRRPLVAVVVLALVSVLAPVAIRGADAAGTKMTGRVVDAATHAGIAGAEVELVNTSGGQGYHRARTDRGGAFTIDGVAADRWYSLTVSAEGYADFVLGAWQFPAEQRAVEVQVPLDRAGAIDVRLTGADGKRPVAGARVQLRSDRGARWWETWRPDPQPVFTDASGSARFEGLTAGAWAVSASASGLLDAEASRVAVRRGERTAVPLKMTRPASISGVVRLADGGPVAGASVVARGAGESATTTGTDGTFALGDLAPGRWRLELQSDGFLPSATREPVALAEGASKDGVAIIAAPRDPEIAFVMPREAFAPDAPPRIGVRAFRAAHVDFALYAIPAERLLDAAHDFRALAASGDTSGLARTASWGWDAGEGSPWAWREEQVIFPLAPRPGAYLLAGTSGALAKRTLLFVTDLGLIVKRSGTRVLVSAASLSNGRPVADATVWTTPGSAAPMPPGMGWSAAVAAARAKGSVTDAFGLLALPVAGQPAHVRVVAVSGTHGVAVVESPLAPSVTEGGDRAFLYTDRPIYRPGDTVNWKLFVRRGTATGYALPDSGRVTLALTGPEASLEVPAATLSARGSADGSVTLGRDLPLGEWTLSARAGRTAASAAIAVEEYRKPEFRVEVAADRAAYVNGDELRFTVAASYFFGAPVFGATVRYNLFESRLRDESAWDEEAGEGEAPGGYGRVLKSGETRTDVDGRVALTFAPERVAYDRRLTLEVEVVDGASRTVSGRATTLMGRGLFTVRLEPLERVAAVGATVPVQVTTADLTGKPVAAAVTVTLDQEAWNPLERRYTRSTRPLASTTVTTDARGKGLASLAPSPARAGRILVRAAADDARGNHITAESSFWVYASGVWDYPYRYPALEAFADRARYQPGDTAKVLVNASTRNAGLLITVEGRDIESSRVDYLRGHTGLFTIPIRAEYAPNVNVAIHLRTGGQVQTRVLALDVAAARHDLAITLTPDREQYRPGDSARVAIATADGAGAPVPAEVSLGVVDEAIYSLRADATPDPHEVFYGRRPDGVTTAVSFPLLYYGGVDKGEKGGVRRDFRDVALWAPTVLTDARGLGEVAFRWPDNLTTWRLTSRGATADTRVGRAVAKSLVTRDIVARFSGPRALVAGDAVTLAGLVNSRMPRPLAGVELSLEGAGPVKVGGRPARADLPAQGEARAAWPVTVAAAPPSGGDAIEPATFTLRAKSRQDADAVETRVPVLARAVPLAIHAAGRLEGASVDVTVTLPNDLVSAGSEIEIDLSPSPAAMALGAVEWLHQTPWTCTEQTANAILPAVAMLEAAKRAGVTLPGWPDPARRLTPFVERLAQGALPTGGWGWWREGDADPYLTALAIAALARARAAGIDPPGADAALRQGVGYALRTLDEARSADAEAYVLAHLATVLALPDAQQGFPGLRGALEELADAVRAQPDRLSPAGLGLATGAVAALGRADQAKALARTLGARLVTDAGGTHAPRSADAWLADDVDATAYALAGLLAADAADARAPALARWLATQRRGHGWRTTRATAPAAAALAAYLAAHPAELKPDYALKVTWDGAPLLERAVTPADAWSASPASVRLTGSRLRPGAHRLSIARQGAGSVDWSYAGRVLVPSPGPATAPEPLAVRREYLHAERVADRRGRPRWLATPLEPGAALHVGEAVLVRLTLVATRDLSDLMIEDPRPAGFEVDDLTPDGVERPWGTHAENRDTRSVFFVESVDAGETVIEYLARPEIAGTLVALPASAGGMYEPDRVARSGEARVTVAGR